MCSASAAARAPRTVAVWRNEEQSGVEDGKIHPLLHQTVPLSNRGAVILSQLSIHLTKAFRAT